MARVLLCGLDEAGRGPLAGPVAAGAVILPPGFPTELLDDSKKLSEKRREAAFERIEAEACWGLGVVGHEAIDQMNILQASLLAMRLAFEQMAGRLPGWAAAHGLSEYDVHAVADGTSVPDIMCAALRCEPKADGRYAEVMAASIIAKVSRDRMMVELDKKYPQYGYARHKGYPTAEHIRICREIGPSPIQRRSFRY